MTAKRLPMLLAGAIGMIGMVAYFLEKLTPELRRLLQLLGDLGNVLWTAPMGAKAMLLVIGLVVLLSRLQPSQEDTRKDERPKLGRKTSTPPPTALRPSQTNGDTETRQ
jgi:hypothetical protein